MNILKQYFHNAKLLKNLTQSSNSNRLSSNNTKEIIQQYGKASLYDIPEAVLTRDYNSPIRDLQSAVLPDVYNYIHYERSIHIFNIGQQVYVKAIYASSETIIALIDDELPNNIKRSDILVVLRLKGKMTEAGGRIDGLVKLHAMSLLMDSLDAIRNHNSKVINPNNTPKYMAKCALWNKRKIVRTPLEYKELTTDICNPINNTVLEDYYMVLKSIQNEPNNPVYQNINKFIDKLQLFSIDRDRCFQWLEDTGYNSKIEALEDSFSSIKEYQKYVISNYSSSSMILPSDYMFIGLRYPNGEEDESVIKALLVSKESIFIMMLHQDTKDFHIYELYNNGTFIDDKHSTTVLLMLVSGVLSYINSFESVSVSSSIDPNIEAMRSKYRSGVKKPIPGAYYTVGLKSVVSDHKHHLPSIPRRECDYAFFVRGHPVHRIAKGTMPIDDQLLKRLQKDERRHIYLSGKDVSDNDKEILSKRGIVVGDDEWVSILTSYRDGHIANSKGGQNPYIPSIHTD